MRGSPTFESSSPNILFTSPMQQPLLSDDALQRALQRALEQRKPSSEGRYEPGRLQQKLDECIFYCDIDECPLNLTFDVDDPDFWEAEELRRQLLRMKMGNGRFEYLVNAMEASWADVRLEPATVQEIEEADCYAIYYRAYSEVEDEDSDPEVEPDIEPKVVARCRAARKRPMSRCRVADRKWVRLYPTPPPTAAARARHLSEPSPPRQETDESAVQDEAAAPPITDNNAAAFPPPNLRQLSPRARSQLEYPEPAIWYSQVTGDVWDGEGRSYTLAKQRWRGLAGGNERRVEQRRNSYQQTMDNNAYQQRRREKVRRLPAHLAPPPQPSLPPSLPPSLAQEAEEADAEEREALAEQHKQHLRELADARRKGKAQAAAREAAREEVALQHWQVRSKRQEVIRKRWQVRSES